MSPWSRPELSLELPEILGNRQVSCPPCECGAGRFARAWRLASPVPPQSPGSADREYDARRPVSPAGGLGPHIDTRDLRYACDCMRVCVMCV